MADPPAAAPALTLPGCRGGPAGLLHRGAAAAAARDCAARLSAGSGAVLVVEGGRGSGRTALLGALVAGCAGGVVLRARCHAGEAGFGWGVAGQLLDRLPGGDKVPVGGTGDGDGGVFDRLYRAVRALVAAGQPVAVAVDDVQWADAPSARWCSYLARRLDDVPAAVLVTVCPAGLAEGPGGELAADLLGLEHARLVRADPLCADCSGELLGRRLGVTVDPEFAAACHGLTGGNPRVLEAAAARLAAAGLAGGVAHGGGGRPRAAAAEVAAQVAAGTVLGWLRHDDSATATVTEHFAICASAAGDATVGGLDTAAMLAGLGEDAAAAARATLRQAGLLSQGAPDRLAHPAMAAAITAQLTPQARAAMHTRAAAMLTQLGAPATAAAEHTMSAGTTGAPWVRRLLRQAAAHAAADGNWPHATRYLNRALLEPGPPEQTLVITADLAASEYHHDLPACLRHTSAAAHLAAANDAAPDSPGTGPGTGTAVLAVLADAGLAAEDGDVAELFCQAAAALATAGDPDRGALLRLAAPALLWAHTLTPGPAAGLPRAMRALATGPPGMPARQLLSALALVAAARGRGRCRAVLLAQRAAAPGPARVTDPLPATLACAALALAWAGELTAAADTCAQALAAAQRAGSPTGQALALLARCEVSCQAGTLATAGDDAAQSLHLFHAVGASTLAAAAAAALTRVQLMRGEPPTSPAQAPAMDATGHPYLLGLQHEAHGMTAAAQASRTLALRHYLQAGRQFIAAGLPNPACSAWRSRAVTVLAGVGRTWEARTLAANEITLARAWGAPGPLGRALVAAATAHDGAARHDLLTEAVDVLEGTGYQLHLARALIRLGAAQHAARPGDAARDLLERGLDLARACGATTLATTAHRAMNAAGTRPRDGSPAPATLTPAERRVAELVVTGLSSQAVAARLTLSKRTVDTHLGRIYRKLGITSRSHLHQAITSTASQEPS